MTATLTRIAATIQARDAADELLGTYDFIRIDENFPRSSYKRCEHCRGCGKEGNETCDNCDGRGVEEQRITWVNSIQTHAARVGDDTVLLMDFGDWFSIVVLTGYQGRVEIGPNLNVLGQKASASTGYYADGGPGSGIHNPDKLQGFVYRTDYKNGQLYRDHYCRPADIIAYLRG